MYEHPREACGGLGIGKIQLHNNKLLNMDRARPVQMLSVYLYFVRKSASAAQSILTVSL